MKLTDSQKRFFYQEGYVKVSSAVPAVMVDAARQAINAQMGKGNGNPFPELNSTPVITDLFNETSVFSLLESALGEGNLQRVNSGGIKLNFPRSPGSSTSIGLSEKIGWGRESKEGSSGHLDGIKAVGDRLRGLREDGTYSRNFTAFAVVYLDHVPVPHGGNFTVWPKSHHFFEDYFKEHGHQVLDDHMPHVDLPQGPEFPTVEAGSVVFAHHMMVHTGGPNFSPNIRYAVIFRPKHLQINEIGFDAFTNIWCEWDGIREVVDV